MKRHMLILLHLFCFFSLSVSPLHFGRPGSFPFIFKHEEAHNWKIPMAHSIKVSVLAFVCPGVRIVVIGKDHSAARKL